ncbi:MAG: hypothetical protein KIT48_15775 [Pseudolabrys sp.]|nr:hypothetical protein [Pseudolabrys sp.]
MTAVRLQCCVPFCRRTRKNENPEYVEWICGDHWPLIDKPRRRVWGRIRGRWRRFGPPAAADAIARRLWACLKRQAIERTTGIAG